MNLDDLTHFQQIDPEHMLGHIDGLPDQCWSAWQDVAQIRLPDAMRQVRQIMIAGMGGSAIGGDLVKVLAEPECAVSIEVLRGYELPAWVQGPDILVIGSSHSGNTEETITAFEQAGQRGAQRIAITSGGELARLAEAAGVPVVPIGYRSQPRAAAGYSFITLVRLLVMLGLLADKEAELQRAMDTLRRRREFLTATSPVARNPAKRLAGQLVQRIPVVFGGGALAPVARRWKDQFNENAKTWSQFEEMPELNHNLIAGVMFPAELMTRIAVIQLVSSFDHPRIRIRHDFTRTMLLQQGIAVDVVKASGDSLVAHLLTAIQFGDYTSYYVAMAYAVDPTPIPPLVLLKEHLAQVGPERAG